MTCVLPRVLPLIAAVSLAACALDSGTSYVAQVETPADGKALADGMVEFVAARLPAASSTVVLDPTPADQASNALTPAFVAALRDRGFAVADGRQADTAGAHHIRYLVTPLDNGDLVRVTIAPKPHASSFGTPPATPRYCAASRPRRAMSDIDGVRQFEACHLRCQIGGIVVHVVGIAGLDQATMEAAIMGDTAEDHLQWISHPLDHLA
jgi:hypothetical protein